MATIAMMLGGALANALAFTGSSFLFSNLHKDSLSKERKRHDLAIEQLQKSQVEWQKVRQQRIDFINKRLILQRKADHRFTELNDALREYARVFGKKLEPLPREPVLSDFYKPSSGQHERELAFIGLSMVMIGGVLYYFER